MVIGETVGKIKVGEKVFVWLRETLAKRKPAKQEADGLSGSHVQAVVPTNIMF
jgi:hypothetical protein